MSCQQVLAPAKGELEGVLILRSYFNINLHYCPVKIEKILATKSPRLQNTQNELIKLVIFGDLVHWWHI